MSAYWHGGPRGLAKILPPVVTGARSTADLRIARGICNPAKVYVTTDYDAALMYAAGHRQGAVYRVDPINPQPDPDCDTPGLSYECDGATILTRHRIAGKQLKVIRRALLEDAA